MRLVLVTSCVLWGLLGQGVASARSAADPESPFAPEPGPPLWSICATYAQPAHRATHEGAADERNGRNAVRIRMPRSPEPVLLETLAELPPGQDSGGGWAHCVPWGPGITGASSGSLMSASSRDDDEIPICLEGAQCSPVSPERPTASTVFNAHKAEMPQGGLAIGLSVRGPSVACDLGDFCEGFPEAPFEPPRPCHAA